MKASGVLILGTLGVLALSQRKAEAVQVQAEAADLPAVPAEDFETTMPVIAPDTISEAPVTGGLRLKFSNPKTVISIVTAFKFPPVKVWDAQLYNLETHQWIKGKPLGIKELHIPMDFDIDSTTFLLKVMEMAGQYGPYWYGPFLVEVFPFGDYTWNSKEGRIDGISATDMSRTANESIITGVIGGFQWVKVVFRQKTTLWACTMQVESVQPVAGKRNWAELFPSIYCLEAWLPLNSLQHPTIKAGARVTCRASIVWAGDSPGGAIEPYAAHWRAWDFQKARDYADEAYEFTGYMRYSILPRAHAYQLDVHVAIDYGVQGTVSPFAAVLVQWNRVSGIPMNTWRLTGPTSGALKDVNTWHGYQFSLFAHPDPNMGFNYESWKEDNWVAAASASVGEWNQWVG